MRRLTLTLAGLLGATAAHATDLYVYVGNNPTADVVQFENMIGRKVDGMVGFNDYRYTPEIGVENLSWGLGIEPKGYKIAVSIPLAWGQPSTNKDHLGAHTMADIGAGKLDGVYAAIGSTLVAKGYPTADVRLGWEENGGWYLWSAPQHEADWHAAFAHASAAIRSTCPKCVIWFNPGVFGDPSKDLPAAGSYDGVAWDTYANSYGPPPTEPGMWAQSLKGWWGIDSEGTWPNSTLPIAIPEFGVGSESSGRGAPDAANKANGGDDGVYMYNALTYFLAHKAKFVGYWNFNAGDYNAKISDASRPHEALAFLQVLGSGHLPDYLKGATLYAGPIKVATPGMRQVVAQLASGHVAALMWGDTTKTVTFDIGVAGAKAMTLYHPLTGASFPPWPASAGCKGYVYRGGLAVIELTP